MEDPYDAPSFGPLLADDSRRPVGVSILSAFTAIMGFVLLAAFVVLLVNWRENNEFFLNRRMAPSILWFFASASIILAFVEAVGMWRGCKWAWWFACSWLLILVAGNVSNAAIANLSHGAPSVATFVSKDSLIYVFRALFVVAVLAYWLRTRVRKYFQVSQTSRIKAIVLSAVCGIGITTLITVVLQTIFLFRMR